MASAATGALAADLPTRKGYADGAGAGLRSGLHLGRPLRRYQRRPSASSHLSNSAFANQTGGLVGGTLGYNWQFGQIVVGGEADFDYGFLKGHQQFQQRQSTTYKTNWLTTERLRLGYAVDRALFYVTGGYAGVSTQASFNGVSGGVAVYRSAEQLALGRRDRRRRRIRLHQQHHREGRISLCAAGQSSTYWGGTPFAETNKQSLSLFRVGLNYKF